MRTKNNSLFDKITEYVDAYFDNNGRSPTTREIENAVKFSRQTVHRYLKVMSEQGEIEYDGHRSICCYVSSFALQRMIKTFRFLLDFLLRDREDPQGVFSYDSQRKRPARKCSFEGGLSQNVGQTSFA